MQLWNTIHILQKKCHTKDLLNNCWKVNGKILYANEPAYTIITKKHQKK